MLRKLLILSSIALSACGGSAEYEAYLKYAEDAKKAGAPILIDELDQSYPNSAGGVDVSIDITNISDKTIKYIRYTVKPYNAVGDVVRGEISRNSLKNLRETGPINSAGKTSGSYWSNVWYNNSIRFIKLTKVNITYMDNTSRTFSSSSSIQKMLAPGVKNSCGVQ
jgi:hypothetical protein